MTDPTRPVSTAARRMAGRVAPPAMAGHPDVDTLAGIQAQVAGLRNAYSAELETSRQGILADKNLSAAGEDREMNQLKQRLGQKYTALLDDLGRRANDVMDVLRQDEEDARPSSVLADQLQAYVRTSKRGDVKRLYEAGISFDEQIRRAQDAETCWALYEEIPVLLLAGGVTRDEVIEPQRWTAVRRIHELEGPQSLEAFDAARAGERIIAGLDGTFDIARTTMLGDMPRGGGLNAAVAAQMAVREMTARHRGLQSNVWDAP